MFLFFERGQVIPIKNAHGSEKLLFSFLSENNRDASRLRDYVKSNCSLITKLGN